ncbi:glucose-6-phosphate dehydrogenase [Calothrix sp. CCY 0018]|uniref:glucose-6-phosphate dehydrogenase n=1 Tax=Calothrix sp. CCY 0018 TaxID=3103864 RepID=UPI0039C5B2B7
MTAFTPSDIPVSINTLEKLSVWVGLGLSKINPTQTAVEGSGPAVKVAEFGIFNVPQNNTTRVILRQSVEIEDDFTYDGGKLWDQAKEFSVNGLPTGFTNPA